MMDRAMGTLAASRGTSVSIAYNYQSGRKDPFSSFSTNLYNILGTAIPTTTAPANFAAQRWQLSYANAVSNLGIAGSVKQPLVYWNDKPMLSTFNVWDDAMITRTSNTNSSKSVFDPCPPGWCVPNYRAYEDFAAARTMKYTNGRPWPVEPWTQLYWPNYNNGSGSPYPIDGMIRFPQLGGRATNGSNWGLNSGESDWWAMNPGSGGSGYGMTLRGMAANSNILSMDVPFSSGNYGFMLRCISRPDF